MVQMRQEPPAGAAVLLLEPQPMVLMPRTSMGQMLLRVVVMVEMAGTGMRMVSMDLHQAVVAAVRNGLVELEMVVMAATEGSS